MLDKSITHIGVLMTKTDTNNYPRYELPGGFTFSGYQPGFEEQWTRLMFAVDQTDTLQEAIEIFNNEFLSIPGLLPKQCLFVLDNTGKIAATASLNKLITDNYNIDSNKQKRYINHYSKNFSLNVYDIQIMPYLLYYQLVMCHYQPPYNDVPDTYKPICELINNHTNWLYENIETLSKELCSL